MLANAMCLAARLGSTLVSVKGEALQGNELLEDLVGQVPASHPPV
jgi:hypothetical protein